MKKMDTFDTEMVFLSTNEFAEAKIPLAKRVEMVPIELIDSSSLSPRISS